MPLHPPFPPPTLETVLRLPPEQAGNLVLEGQQHRRITAIVVPPANGPTPPGVTDVELVEEARAERGGCMRQRWHVTFQAPTGEAAAAGTMRHARASTEIALPANGQCAPSDYTTIATPLTPTEGFAALAMLVRFHAGGGSIVFKCTDVTGSKLCRTFRSIRAGLKAGTPWMAMRRQGDIVFWLRSGQRGHVTEVRYNELAPDMVTVDRRYPAPF